MTKLTFNRISSLINAPTTINGIIAQIESAFDRVLFRDGTAPNQMSGNLDMNSKRILNLPYPTSSNEPVRVQDFAVFLAAYNFALTNFIWVWQIKEALKDLSLLDTVEAAISPVTSDSINIFWTMGGITSVGDTLSEFIKSTLSWNDTQIHTLYESAKAKYR